MNFGSSCRRSAKRFVFGIGGLLVDWLGLVSLAAASLQVSDTKFSRDRGFYEQPVEVVISTKTAGARIYYTTNGSAPSPDSARLYTGPVRLTRSTVVRAAAFRPGLKPSNIDTHSYLFPPNPADPIDPGFPQTWGINVGQPVPADYGIDPDIVHHTAYSNEWVAALRALPALSIVMALPDLFDVRSGIYSNPKETGDAWERPASAEMLYPDGRPGWQIDGGIRIQGGWNRRPEESPKHSFRLVFRKKYGPKKLSFPLFGDAGAKEFDTLILRAGCNNTWLHWSGEERARGDFLRDQWMRDTYRAMGHLSARGVFVHLYLNGVYWGIYNPTERPSGPFLASYRGGTPDDFEVRNGNHVLSANEDGWQALLQQVNAGVTADEPLARIGELVDLPALVDFLILNFYGANADWDRSSNWYAARRTRPPGPFHFFVWDGERTLEQVEANTMAFDDDQSPPRLFHRLRGSAAFRQLFAERARHHLTGDGALTPQACAERYAALAQSIDRAILGESARWGDYRRDHHRYKVGPYELYTRDDHWRPEVRRLLTDYFPRRSAVVLEQFRAAGLYEPDSKR